MSTELQQRLRDHLESLAKKGETISYRQLAELAEIPTPQVIRHLTELLENIIREDHAESINASVASLAVSQAAPAMPRAGYFMLLRKLGVYSGPNEGEQAEVFHADCLQKIFTRFSS
jgi:DNA-binding Lrp family transcriptional regulator